MKALSKSALHSNLEALLKECTADELKQLVIALGDDEPPRNRQSFLERVRHHQRPGDSAADAPEEADELKGALDYLAMEIAATAEAEENEWWEDEDILGPFAHLMPRVHALLDQVGEQLARGRVVSAHLAYERIWSMLDVESDYGRQPSLEDDDLETAREHAARYLRAVFLISEPGERVEAMLAAAERVRFSGFTARPATLYLTLQEIDEVEATSLPGWEAFLDALVTAISDPRDLLQNMWLREALQQRQGAAGMAMLARRKGVDCPEAWLDWIREAVRKGDVPEALTAWQEAQGHFPRRAEIWAPFADLMLQDAASIEPEQRTAIAFEALIAKPSPRRLLTLLESLVDDNDRHALLRRVALCLSTPPEDNPGRSQETSASSHGHLATPSAFERRASVAVLAWLLVGEWQQARDLADQDDVVGWSLGDNARWALCCCAPVALAGRPPRESGPATQIMWRQLAQDELGQVFGDAWLSVEGRAPTAHGAEVPVADRLGDALAAACRRFPLSPSEAMTWLQWCFETARARCHAIVSRQHRKAYDRAACTVMASVEAAAAMGHEGAGQQFLRDIRTRYPRHTAFQRALTEYGPGTSC